MMLALCAAVTFLRPLSSAYLKAASTIRSEPKIEIGLIEMPASSRTVAPRPASASRSLAASSLPCSNSMPA